MYAVCACACACADRGGQVRAVAARAGEMRVMQRAARDKSNFEMRRGPRIDVRDWQRANFLRE